jgi:hypothetical protein
LISNGCLNYGQLQDYLAILDQDRMEVVCKLKETFDRLDVNKDGLLDLQEIQSILDKKNVDQEKKNVFFLFLQDFFHQKKR